jgi:hypothetical protein
MYIDGMDNRYSRFVIEDTRLLAYRHPATSITVAFRGENS